MPRMRTIEETIIWIHENDPESAITKTALRRLVVSGQIPSIRLGAKYLLDLDKVTAFFMAA